MSEDENGMEKAGQEEGGWEEENEGGNRQWFAECSPGGNQWWGSGGVWGLACGVADQARCTCPGKAVGGAGQRAAPRWAERGESSCCKSVQNLCLVYGRREQLAWGAGVGHGNCSNQPGMATGLLVSATSPAVVEENL